MLDKFGNFIVPLVTISVIFWAFYYLSLIDFVGKITGEKNIVTYAITLFFFNFAPWCFIVIETLFWININLKISEHVTPLWWIIGLLIAALVYALAFFYFNFTSFKKRDSSMQKNDLEKSLYEENFSKKVLVLFEFALTLLSILGLIASLMAKVVTNGDIILIVISLIILVPITPIIAALKLIIETKTKS